MILYTKHALCLPPASAWPPKKQRENASVNAEIKSCPQPTEFAFFPGTPSPLPLSVRRSSRVLMMNAPVIQNVIDRLPLGGFRLVRVVLLLVVLICVLCRGCWVDKGIM
jgi:hypothetical protein